MLLKAGIKTRGRHHWHTQPKMITAPTKTQASFRFCIKHHARNVGVRLSWRAGPVSFAELKGAIDIGKTNGCSVFPVLHVEIFIAASVITLLAARNFFDSKLPLHSKFSSSISIFLRLGLSVYSEAPRSSYL